MASDVPVALPPRFWEAASPFPARPYQRSLLEQALAFFPYHRSVLMTAATGTGKTVTFAHACRAWRFVAPQLGLPERALILVHRDELVQQARAKCGAVCAGEIVEVEHGRQYAEREEDARGLLDLDMAARSRIVVASKDTLWRAGRLTTFRPDEFGLIVVDEAHHWVRRNKTYHRVISYFPRARVLGVTATADRSDGRALGATFEAACTPYGLLPAINDGWLVPIVQQLVTVTDYDLSEVRATKGETGLSEEEVDRVLRREKVVSGLCHVIMELSNKQTKWGGGRPTLVFAASVPHARAMAHYLNGWHARHGTGAAAALVDEDCSGDVRRSLIDEYRRGGVRYLVNYGVLVEGFDAPETRLVAICRPTTSRQLYEQMVGRGTRPSDTIVAALNRAATAEERRALILNSCKPGVLVFDPVGNSGQHKLVTALDVLGGWYDRAEIDDALQDAKAAGKPADVSKALEEARRRRRERDAALRRDLLVKASWTSRLVDPFDLLDLTPGREPAWAKRQPASDGQLALLERKGFDPAQLEGLTRGRAKQILDEVIGRERRGLCSVHDLALLARYGVDARDFTEADAWRAQEDLRARGWPRPAAATY